MLKDPDHSFFEQDMVREVSNLLHTDTIKIAHCSSVPDNLAVLPSIWSFQRERAPDWTTLKHKARRCHHGGRQVEGEHFWETDSPVVNWRTVCLVLILGLLADLKSRQIGYVNTFMQASADCDIFMTMPAGFQFRMTLYDLLVHLNVMLLQIMFFISKRICMAFGRPVITGLMFFTLLFFLWVTLRVNMIPISLFAKTPSFLFMLMIVFFSVALMMSWIALFLPCNRILP
jgi:hypothetical protein